MTKKTKIVSVTNINGALDISFSLPNKFAVAASGGIITEDQTSKLHCAAKTLGADDLTLDTTKGVLTMHFFPAIGTEMDLTKLLDTKTGATPLTVVDELFQAL